MGGGRAAAGPFSVPLLLPLCPPGRSPQGLPYIWLLFSHRGWGQAKGRGSAQGARESGPMGFSLNFFTVGSCPSLSVLPYLLMNGILKFGLDP